MEVYADADQILQEEIKEYRVLCREHPWVLGGGWGGAWVGWEDLGWRLEGRRWGWRT